MLSVMGSCWFLKVKGRGEQQLKHPAWSGLRLLRSKSHKLLNHLLTVTYVTVVDKIFITRVLQVLIDWGVSHCIWPAKIGTRREACQIFSWSYFLVLDFFNMFAIHCNEFENGNYFLSERHFHSLTFAALPSRAPRKEQAAGMEQLVWDTWHGKA